MSVAGRLTVVLGFAIALVGCYTLQPMRGVQPEVGTTVAFDVNDSGRIVLGGAMGPQIAQVEGQLVSKDSTGFLVAVSTIRLLQGGQQVWSGEQVRLDSRFLGTGYEKRFSLARTLGLGAVGAGGIAAFIAGFSWATNGADPLAPPGDSSNTRVGRP